MRSSVLCAVFIATVSCIALLNAAEARSVHGGAEAFPTFNSLSRASHARESFESLNRISLWINTTWTSATLEQVLCPLVAGNETDTESVSITYTDYYELIPENFVPLLVPDCFWTLTQLQEITMQMVLLTGSNQEPDPLVRLPSTLRSITLQYSRLVNPKVTGSTFKMNWNAFFASKPDLTVLELNRLSIDASMPTLIPSALRNFNVPQNLISGTIPADLLSNYPTDSSVHISFANNKLTGSVPITLFANYKGSSIDFDASSNMLIGPVPRFSLSSIYYIGLNFVPSLLENAPFEALSSAYLVLANNSLIGPLTPQLIGSGHRAEDFSLDISSNPIGGTIPNDLFSSYVTDSNITNRYLAVSIGNCGLTGALPSIAVGIRFLDLNADNNALNALPTSSWASYLTSIAGSLGLSVAHNNFTGELFLPNRVDSRLILNVYGNDFTSLIIGAKAGYIADLNLGMNKRLTGTLPNSLFADSNAELTLIANYTALTGEFPKPNRYLYGLDVSNTAIDFCGSSWTSPWDTILVFCSLKNTNAGSCINKYPPPCQYDFNRTQLVPGVPSSGVPSTIPIGDNPSVPNGASSTEHQLIFCCLMGLVLLFLSI